MASGDGAGREPLLPAAPAHDYGAAGDGARDVEASAPPAPVRARSVPTPTTEPSEDGGDTRARRGNTWFGPGARQGSTMRSTFSLRSPRGGGDAPPPYHSRTSAFWARINKMWRGPVVDSMTYKADVLTSWSSLFQLQGVKTAFSSPTAWQTMGRLVLLSIVVAVLLLIVVPNPAQMKTSKFQQIAVFLRVFVGLLLGFFLSTSVNRWFECTQGFLELYDSIRSLQVQLLALGVPMDRREKVLRYATVSGWLLGMTLQIEALPGEEDKKQAAEAMYESLRSDADGGSEQDDSPRLTDRLAHRFNVLEDQEIAVIKSMGDPASMMWIWVASYIGRMANDGWIPPMASPTYGLLMSCVKEAHHAIRSVRQSVLVQAPFIYVHLLASLVHVNNIVNAISFGIVLGSCIGTGLQYHGASGVYSTDSRSSEVVADLENLIISFFICLVGPFLYQVLLEVCICISQPFASEESQIPTDRLMQRLQKDLTDARRMASSLPSWSPPAFSPVRQGETTAGATARRTSV